MELNGYNDTAIFVKAITELWELNGYNDTAIFVKAITELWN